MYVTNIWGCAFFFGGIGACFGALGVVTLLAAFAHKERRKISIHAPRVGSKVPAGTAIPNGHKNNNSESILAGGEGKVNAGSGD